MTNATAIRNSSLMTPTDGALRVGHTPQGVSAVGIVGLEGSPIIRSDNGRSIPIEHIKTKFCRACGVTKLTSDFYTIRDYGSQRLLIYPSARCKPCHNESCRKNQAIRRAKRRTL